MINVKSEIGHLEKVLLHRPGRELLNLTPSNIEALLFDDIPYLKAAQNEHDAFARVLKQRGANVVYLEDLAADVLNLSEKIKTQFVRQYIEESGLRAKEHKKAVFDFLMRISGSKNLILKTMEGISHAELDSSLFNSLENLTKPHNKLLTEPMPNLYFTRDTMVVVGDGICINNMYSVTRKRESIYGEYIFKYHPDFAKISKHYYKRTDPFHIEGGDLTNLNAHTIAVGVSQRTCAPAVEALAQNLFADKSCQIKTVLAFSIPAKRAFMHLDTVFTQIDTDKFIIHPGILQTLEVFALTPAKKGSVHIKKTDKPLEKILSFYLKTDYVSLTCCGGDNMIAAEREQWNDGSNTLCVAPGELVVYERNEATNELLAAQGIKLHPVCSSELSRGRGGPRCMSMPLIRS